MNVNTNTKYNCDKDIPYDSGNIMKAFKAFIELPIWVVFKVVDQHDGTFSKLPFNPNSDKKNPSNASSTDPKTWATYLEALEFLKSQKGKCFLGIALDGVKDLVVFDLDHVVYHPNGGDVFKGAIDIAQSLNSYIEYSQSGTGLHLYCFGTKPGKKCKVKVKENYYDKWELEIYDSKRFILVTGRVFDGFKPIRKAQNEIEAVYHQYFPETQQNAKESVPNSPKLTDVQVLTLLSKEKKESKVYKLLTDGKRYSGDESSMDLAIINKITFYTQASDQIDRLFRNSEYYKTKTEKAKKKWEDRGDYGPRTFAAALKNCSAFYQPSHTTPTQDPVTSFKKLREGLIPEEKFPVELLPKVIRDIVKLIATGSDSDPAIAGSAAQSLAAIALKKSVTVVEKKRPYIWHYLSFFHAVVGASAEARKTANTKDLLNVLERYHSKKKDKYKKDQHTYKNAKKVADAAVKEIHKTTAPGSLHEKAVQAAEIESAAEDLKPNFYRLFSTDITGPAFYQRLDETNGTYSIFTTDAGDLIDFIIGNSQTGTNDMVFVKLITRDHIHIDRVGTDRKGVEIDVPDPCGNLFIMTQEERWDRFTNHPRLRGSGLHGRCNPVILPPREKGYIEEDESDDGPIFGEEIKPWDTMIETFLSFEGNISLTLSKEAAVRRKELNNEWQETVGISQENYDVKDIVHRFVSECVKRAALFHVCDYWDKLHKMPTEIPVKTFSRATAVQKYYLQQALNNRRGALNKIESREIERFITKWIDKIETKKELTGNTSPRELQQYLHMKKEQLEKFLGELEDCDVVIKIAKDGKKAARYALDIERAKAYIK